MRSTRSEIERLVPALRQFARALVDGHRAEFADDLVHEAVEDTLRGERSWAPGEVELRLYARLLRANRARIEAAGHRAISGGGTAPADPGRRLSPGAPTRGTVGLDRLPLGEREALLLTGLARLDYPQAAEALGIPLTTLVVRLAHARDALGSSLWDVAPGRSRPAGAHLRLVRP